MLDFDRIREEVLELLGPYGVRRIAVFGSVARGEERDDSDIDILITLEEPRSKPLGLIAWVGIEDGLSARLGRPVQLVSEAALSKYIRPYVEEDEVVLYERAS